MGENTLNERLQGQLTIYEAALRDRRAYRLRQVRVLRTPVPEATRVLRAPLPETDHDSLPETAEAEPDLDRQLGHPPNRRLVELLRKRGPRPRSRIQTRRLEDHFD